MPLYVYRAKDGEAGCAQCREDFEVLQRLDEPALETCPSCGAPVEKQVTTANAAFPQGPAALRNLGFARLEKRADGKYENVSAQDGAQKVGSLEDFSKSLTKGKKPIIRD